MIQKENKNFRKMFIVTEYAALTKNASGLSRTFGIWAIGEQISSVFNFRVCGGKSVYIEI